MLDVLNNFMVAMMDYVLGWTLCLPRDLTLFAVAALTSGVLVLARVLSTNQDWLKRAAADVARLGQLAKAAKRAGEKAAAVRYKSTITLIKMRSLKYEGRPLLYATIPIALVATWCFARLGYEPPRAGDTVEVRAYFSTAAVGRLAHLVPQDGLEAADGWIQAVVADSPAAADGWWDAACARIRGWFGAGAPAEGEAVWRLKARGDGGRYVLRLRYGGRTYEKELLVGSRHYAAPAETFEEGPVRAVEIVMPQVKLFGLVGGLDFLYLPPWLVAYLLIAMPLVSIIKRVFRIG